MFKFVAMFSRVRLRVDEPNAVEFDTITARPTFIGYDVEEKGERHSFFIKFTTILLHNTAFFFFPVEQTSREDHRCYLEKPQHLQRRWPIRHRGLKLMSDRLLVSL